MVSVKARTGAVLGKQMAVTCQTYLVVFALYLLDYCRHEFQLSLVPASKWFLRCVVVLGKLISLTVSCKNDMEMELNQASFITIVL